MPRKPPFHVWVDLTGMWRGAVPGVLTAWRWVDNGKWEAWVVRAEAYSTGRGAEVLVKGAWVPAELVKPVTSDLQSPRGANLVAGP